jgi:S-methylmethionine-dependent homocysteine/selenocysteine methylase
VEIGELERRLKADQVVLLDGATGTELARRGVNVSLPLWSARALVEAPQVLLELQREYVRAGAQVLTANTFRAHRRSLERGGWGERWPRLVHEAVAIAKAAAGGRALVAGSLAPLEDCYRPELSPDEATCVRGHAEMARELARAGADLLLIETMNRTDELLAAARMAQATGLPWMASVICAGATGPAPTGRAYLLGGERLDAAVRGLEALGPLAILVNCAPVEQGAQLVTELRATTSLPVGIYANAGHLRADGSWTDQGGVDPEEYARAAQEWHRAGARVLGGCCGTTSAHVARLARAWLPAGGAL